MNKEFEEWFKENYSELDPMLIDAFKEVAFKAWKAGSEHIEKLHESLFTEF